MFDKTKNILRFAIKDSLYSNSFYLMASTLVLSVFGFLFWILNARLFTSEQVGLATGLWSIVSLISGFSSLGLDSGLVRFLPSSKRKNSMVNTVFSIILIASAVASLFYLAFIHVFSPKLAYIREDFLVSAAFVLIIVINSFSNIIETVFVAYRSCLPILIKSVIFSIIKLVLPVFFISFGVSGILFSIGLSLLVGCSYGLILLIFKFRYRFKLKVNKKTVKKVYDFSFGNFVATFIATLPVLMLPILVLNSMGARYSAYYYMDRMIANMIYIIPIAVSQSLLAEGSYRKDELAKHLHKAFKIIALLLIPTVILTLLFGKYALLIFGKEYSVEGLVLLNILAISGIFVSINHVGATTLKITHNLRSLVSVNTFGSVAVFVLSFFWFRHGLIGVGYAWLVSQLFMSMSYVFLWFKK